MGKQETAAASLGGNTKLLIQWLIAIGVPVLIYFGIPQTAAVSLEMRKFFTITIWAILTWAMNLMPGYVAGLLLTMLGILWNVAPSSVSR